MAKREPQTPGDVPQHEPASQADSTQAEDLGEPSMPMSEVRRLIAQETAKAVAEHPDAQRVPVLCADGWYVQPDAYAAPDQAKR